MKYSKSEAVALPSLMIIALTLTVCEESLVRDIHTDKHTNRLGFVYVKILIENKRKNLPSLLASYQIIYSLYRQNSQPFEPFWNFH